MIPIILTNQRHHNFGQNPLISQHVIKTFFNNSRQMMESNCIENNEKLEKNNIEPVEKKIKTESLDLWEEIEFQQLDEIGCNLNFLSENSQDDVNILKKSTTDLLNRFSEMTFDWNFSTNFHKKAMLLVALYLDTGINWDYRSDITGTRVLATLYFSELRAHPDGIFYYANGAWKKIKEIPESILNGLEQVFNISQIYFSQLCNSGTEKAWDVVFNTLKNAKDQSLSESNVVYGSHHWAINVGKTLKDLLARFTNTNREESILKQYGRWFQTKKPDANGKISDYDAAVRF